MHSIWGQEAEEAFQCLQSGDGARVSTTWFLQTWQTWKGRRV